MTAHIRNAGEVLVERLVERGELADSDEETQFRPREWYWSL